MNVLVSPQGSALPLMEIKSDAGKPKTGKKGKKNATVSASQAPTFKGSAATVKESSGGSSSPAPAYVTSIKSSRSATQSPKSSPKSQSSPALKRKTRTATKAAATTSHAKSPKDLVFDATVLGVLDPTYTARLFKEGFISARGWDHLRTGYRYTGVDHSFCGNRFLYLWWNLVVERFVPLWVAYVVLLLICNYFDFSYFPHQVTKLRYSFHRAALTC
jgi:hypothetical protein